jgi:hypothetical protein
VIFLLTSLSVIIQNLLVGVEMKILGTLLLSIGVFVGCGGEKSVSTATDGSEPLKESSIKMSNIAKDNMLRDVDKTFGKYTIKVYTDAILGEDSVSNDTFALYGEIDGENTAALLKLNSNYPVGTKIIVKVFDKESKKLLVVSEPAVYSGGIVNFGTLQKGHEN